MDGASRPESEPQPAASDGPGPDGIGPAPDEAQGTPAPSPGRSRARGGAGRACIGLGLSGQGLGILVGIVPHEDLLVGIGLLAFGIVLLATSRLPVFPIRAGHLRWTGLAMLAVVAAAWVWTREPPTGPKLVLVAIGVAALAASFHHQRRFTLRSVSVRAGDAVAYAFVAVAAPLGIWLTQAAFKHVAGRTPLEAFMVAFLVIPVHWILAGLGLDSEVHGQTLTLAGPTGPMPVEIGVACSGIQAMALFLLILGLFAAFERPSGKRLAAWVAVGLVGVYVTNLVRLVAILLAGHAWGPVTLEEVHANAGWAFFVAWTLLFAWWVRRGLEAGPRVA